LETRRIVIGLLNISLYDFTMQLCPGTYNKKLAPMRLSKYNI